MTARVLVVDDIEANVKLLEARLVAEYFDVVTAMSGEEAIAICQRGEADIVLLDVMMPGMDGFETCRRLKQDTRTHHLPIIMVTALDQPSDRVRGLEAGADDFLTKPVGEIALISRVKSLVRLKSVIDELKMRMAAGEDAGINSSVTDILKQPARDGRILVVDTRQSSCDRIQAALGNVHQVDTETDPQNAVFKAAEGGYELAIVSLSLDGFDGLRLCSQLRSLERTRHMPILVLADPEDNSRLLRSLDLGVNDYVVRPIDKNELFARVRTQIRRQRYTEQLRDSFHHSVELAITDPLTQLHNRRYMENHLGLLVAKAQRKGGNLSLLIIDIDYFKAINDSYGHDAGDEVLRNFSERLRKNVRGMDLVCRYGGEEFVVVLPDTGLPLALAIGERLRTRVAGDAFPIRGGNKTLNVTVSVGIATLTSPEDTPESLIKRADRALYSAKRDGRNRVVSSAA
jgi:two-component system, cell cycle response regulator